MENTEQPPDNRNRVKITTEYDPEQRTFLLALEGSIYLGPKDILAGLLRMVEHARETVKEEELKQAAYEAEKKRTGLVDPAGRPVSSEIGPKLVVV